MPSHLGFLRTHVSIMAAWTLSKVIISILFRIEYNKNRGCSLLTTCDCRALYRRWEGTITGTVESGYFKQIGRARPQVVNLGKQIRRGPRISLVSGASCQSIGVQVVTSALAARQLRPLESDWSARVADNLNGGRCKRRRWRKKEKNVEHRYKLLLH